VRIIASWTAGGAIFFGGYVAVAMGLANQGEIMMGYGGYLFLAGIGAVAGFVHGSALAVLGRAPDTPAAASVRGIARGVFWALPLLVFALILSPIIALGSAAVAMRQPLLMGVAAVAAIAGAGICAWAAVEGWQALVRACDRWPEHRWGIPMVLVTLLVLLVAFVAQRPQIWWTDIQVTQIGAILLALGATLWLAIPVEYLALHLLHRWQGPSRDPVSKHP
jgi:hypothetical protein